MLSRRLGSHLAFLFVGIMSLLLAVFLATRVIKLAKSQDEVGVAPPTTPQPGSKLAPSPAGAATPPLSPAAVAEAVKAAAQAQSPTAAAAEAILNAEDGQAAPSAVGASPIPTVESVSFLEPYVFDLREGRRNPFRAPTLADGTMADMMLPGTPLERYDLNELKLVGILWDVKTPKAMMVDPQGEVHVLGKDDRVGRKRGYIAVIREGEVVVVETSNFNGENAYSTRVMRIDK